MSAGAIVAGARHVLAVERRQRAIVLRSPDRARSAWWQGLLAWAAVAVWRLALPALVVVGAWRDAATREDGFPSGWGFAAMAGVLLGGRLFQSRALEFSPRDVLFHPDRAAVLAARVWRALPLLLGTGAAWAFACWLQLRPLAAEQPLAVAATCAIALCAPLAWNVGELLRRLLAPGASSSLGLALFAALVLGFALRVSARDGSDTFRWLVLGLVLVCGGVPAAAAVWIWLQRPAAQARALWAEVMGVSRLLVVAVLVAPTGSLGPWLALANALAAASLALCFAVAWRQVLDRVPRAEVIGMGAPPAEAGATTRARRSAGRAVPAHRGRSPWRGAWRRQGSARGAVWRAALRALAGTAMLTPAMLHGEPRYAVFALAAGLFAPAVVGAPRDQRLYLWGVDHREQVRQHLAAVLLGAALPALLGAVVLATLLGWTEARALLLAGAAAAFVLRAGWPGLDPRSELAPLGSGPALLAAAVLAGSIWLPLLQWWTVALAAAFGVAGVLRRLARPEAELAAAAAAGREGAGRPAADPA